MLEYFLNAPVEYAIINRFHITISKSIFIIPPHHIRHPFSTPNTYSPLYLQELFVNQRHFPSHIYHTPTLQISSSSQCKELFSTYFLFCLRDQSRQKHLQLLLPRSQSICKCTTSKIFFQNTADELQKRYKGLQRTFPSRTSNQTFIIRVRCFADTSLVVSIRENQDSYFRRCFSHFKHLKKHTRKIYTFFPSPKNPYNILSY